MSTHEKNQVYALICVGLISWERTGHKIQLEIYLLTFLPLNIPSSGNSKTTK